MKIIKKVREREGENYNNKNAKVEELKIKSQAAMEYLMTYGWAILIIALTLAVLYSLGIMNPKNFLPRAPPGSCFVFRPNGPGTTDFVSLQGTCGYLPMYVASFNGVNGYVRVPRSTSLEPPTITVVAWFNANKLQGAGILGKHTWVNGKIQGFFFQVKSDGSIQFATGDGSTGYLYLSSGAGSYKPRTWVNVVGINTGGTSKIYVNGVLKNSSSSPYTPYPVDFGVGVWAVASGYFNGSIANVQIYNTALNDQEIQYLYQQGLGGAPIRLGSLVGWWPLNGDAKDYSGNNNHGTINGGVTFVQNYNPP